MMSFKIHAERDLCQGAGQCVLHAPDVFDQDEQEGLVEVLQPVVGDDHEKSLKLAESWCPARAIRIEHIDDSAD